MLSPSLFLALGIVLLIGGANWLVSGASSLANRYNVSNLTIGLTIVAFGTSSPELIVNVFASLQGHQDILLGNIIGSNNFNLFFILGVAGLITPLAVHSNTVWREIPISLFAAILLFIIGNGFFSDAPNTLSRLDGVLLLFCFAGFMYYVFLELKTVSEEKASTNKQSPIWKSSAKVISGLAGLIIGGNLVMQNAITIASELGVSEKVIGLTIVAAGTSLPELATTVIAAVKKNIDLAVGNVIGSNIFNIFFILATSVTIHPIVFDPSFNMDLILLMVGTLLLFIAMFTGVKKKLERWEAFILLMLFISYTFYLITQT